MAASSKHTAKEMREELLHMCKKIKEMSCELDSSNLYLKCGSSLPYLPECDAEVLPDTIDSLVDEMCAASKTFAAAFRKYYDLSVPTRRQAPARHPRQDSGIESGLFEEQDIPAPVPETPTCQAIMESGEPQPDMKTAELVSSSGESRGSEPVEHGESLVLPEADSESRL